MSLQLTNNSICSTCIELRLLARESYGCCRALRNGKLPNPLLVLISPSTLDKTRCGVILSLNIAQTLIRNWSHNNMLKARRVYCGRYSCSTLPNPLANATISVVVKAILTLWTPTIFKCIAVPTLPNCRCTIIYRVEPARILALEEQFISNIFHPILGKGGHKD